MSDAAGHLPPQIDIVVGDDGRVVIPREQLANLGLGPGAHLRLVSVSPPQMLDDLFAGRDDRRKTSGIEPMSGDEAAELADDVTKRVRRQIYEQSVDSDA